MTDWPLFGGQPLIVWLGGWLSITQWRRLSGKESSKRKTHPPSKRPRGRPRKYLLPRDGSMFASENNTNNLLLIGKATAEPNESLSETDVTLVIKRKHGRPRKNVPSVSSSCSFQWERRRVPPLPVQDVKEDSRARLSSSIPIKVKSWSGQEGARRKFH